METSHDPLAELQREFDMLQTAFDALWDEHKGCGYSVSSPEVTIEYKVIDPPWQPAPGLDSALISMPSRTEVTATITQDGTKWTLTTDRWTMEKLA
jgi:hypothetical protein